VQIIHLDPDPGPATQNNADPWGSKCSDPTLKLDLGFFNHIKIQILHLYSQLYTLYCKKKLNCVTVKGCRKGFDNLSDKIKAKCGPHSLSLLVGLHLRPRKTVKGESKSARKLSSHQRIKTNLLCVFKDLGTFLQGRARFQNFDSETTHLIVKKSNQTTIQA
jgi:hypothetical protein